MKDEADEADLEEVEDEGDTRRARKQEGSSDLLVGAALLAAALLALYLLSRGKGSGGLLGTGNTGEGSPPPLPPATAQPAHLRVDGSGYQLNGAPATLGECILAAKLAGSAEVVVAGDATQGRWEALRDGLDGAGVKWSKKT